MGQNQSGFMPDGQQGDKKKKPEKKKWQPPAPPTRVGKKLKKKGLDGANRLPNVTPASKCLLRKLKLERVKDWLLMEEEFVGNQERIKPHTERAEEEKSKVDDLRGAPMSVGNLEEIIDDKCVARDIALFAFRTPERNCVPIIHREALPTRVARERQICPTSSSHDAATVRPSRRRRSLTGSVAFFLFAFFRLTSAVLLSSSLTRDRPAPTLRSSSATPSCPRP